MARFSRPDIPDGYLGAQPTFEKIGLKISSHKDGEFPTSENIIEIKFKTTDPVKLTHRLLECKNESECSEYVFYQTNDDIVSFNVAMPQSGYYKLEIYGLQRNDSSKTLPNVFNYMILCKRALKPVHAFPKQYANWKEGCFLYAPLVLHKDSTLAHVNWKVSIPKASAVAVIENEEWHHFKKDGDYWTANFNLVHLRGKNAKVVLNACIGSDETKYIGLLEYTL